MILVLFLFLRLISRWKESFLLKCSVLFQKKNDFNSAMFGTLFSGTQTLISELFKLNSSNGPLFSFSRVSVLLRSSCWHSIVGSVVEFSPATRETGVRFPDNALLSSTWFWIRTAGRWGRKRSINSNVLARRKGEKDAETRDWTRDLQIFSLTLSQLSYFGWDPPLLRPDSSPQLILCVKESCMPSHAAARCE